MVCQLWISFFHPEMEDESGARRFVFIDEFVDVLFVRVDHLLIERDDFHVRDEIISGTETSVLELDGGHFLIQRMGTNHAFSGM